MSNNNELILFTSFNHINRNQYNKSLIGKKMGNMAYQKEKKPIVVTTINYSGILNSPFQFYSAELRQEEESLSKIFELLIKKYFKEYNRSTFKWNLGKIDQKMQKQRYTPIYRADCGIKGKKLITNIEEFNLQWENEFQTNKIKIEGLKYEAEEKERAKLFDWLCYQSILYHVYDVKDLLLIDQNNQEPYKNFMKKFYSKAFLVQTKKIVKTMVAIQKQQTDIMFIQESNQKLIQNFDKQAFYIVQSESRESIIVIRKSKFTKIHNEKQIMNILGENISKSLNWNNDSVVAFVDNLILISGHLSSKKQKNAEQVQSMIQSLKKLKIVFPDRKIIVGCDANSYIKAVPQPFNIYPNKENITTTLKMRTMLQPQLAKAEVVANQCRDHLITDLPMQRPRVVSILGIQAQKVGYLPCQSHPYDHFVVTAYIDI